MAVSDREAKSKGGYECEFLNEVPDSLICLICKYPARNPHQTQCCGKVLCKYCLDQQNSGFASTCSNCRSRQCSGFHDKRSERDILSFRVKCSYNEYGCPWQGELREMEKHAEECSQELISCPYSMVGCKKKLLKKNLATHNLAVDHLAMALGRIELLNNRVQKLEVKIPPVVFQMQRFKFLRDNCVEWDSPPFYTHSEGYKLYIKVYANGLDEAIGSHVSVMVCLMRGEFDEKLKWPFRGTISFELLNQESDSDHKEGVARFMERRSSPKNRKVTADNGKNNVGWGVTKLLKLDDGDDDSDDDSDDDDSLFDDYVIDDCLYIRVSQATVSDMNKPWLI